MAHCITLSQVKDEAVRRVKEDDGEIRLVYIRKDNNKLAIRTWMNPMIATDATLLSVVTSSGKLYDQ